MTTELGHSMEVYTFSPAQLLSTPSLSKRLSISLSNISQFYTDLLFMQLLSINKHPKEIADSYSSTNMHVLDCLSVTFLSCPSSQALGAMYILFFQQNMCGQIRVRKNDRLKVTQWTSWVSGDWNPVLPRHCPTLRPQHHTGSQLSFTPTTLTAYHGLFIPTSQIYHCLL